MRLHVNFVVNKVNRYLSEFSSCITPFVLDVRT
jgi:hypothetical protein